MSYTFTNIEDVKNRARWLKREYGGKLHECQDLAAKAGGFGNFRHAQNVLPKRPKRYPVNLHCYWAGQDSRETGTAEIDFELLQPLPDVLRPHHLTGYLGATRIIGEQKLERRGLQLNAEGCRWGMAKVVRCLQFMDATGLKPSRARRAYPKNNGFRNEGIPLGDHRHGWYDPIAEIHLFTSEPYPTRVEAREVEQPAWDAKHGYVTLPINWGGIYGVGTEFFLSCPSSYADVARRKIAKLEQYETAISDKEVTVNILWPREKAGILNTEPFSVRILG